jgi:uncharacterized protein YbjT (DUF2867 family)
VPPDALNQVRVEANFIDAAKRAGLELLVKLSIIGADSKSPGAIAQWHGMAERRIEASGLPYVFLRPNFCMQNMLWFAPSIKAEDRFRMAAGAGRAALVDARDVANVGAAVLTEPGHVGRTYTLTGPRALDFAQVADLLSAELGRKIAFIDASISDFKQVVMEWGASDPYAEALLAVWRPVCAGRYEPVTDDVRMITGVPPTDFAQFARDYAGAFR